MKIVTLKFKLIIGIVLFVVIVCAAYYEKYVIHLPSGHNEQQFESSGQSNSSQIGVFQYKGKFLTPVENFKVVTSKFGYRTHPITRRKRQFSFRNRFSWRCRKSRFMCKSWRGYLGRMAKWIWKLC